MKLDSVEILNLVFCDQHFLSQSKHKDPLPKTLATGEDTSLFMILVNLLLKSTQVTDFE